MFFSGKQIAWKCISSDLSILHQLMDILGVTISSKSPFLGLCASSFKLKVSHTSL